MSIDIVESVRPAIEQILQQAKEPDAPIVKLASQAMSILKSVGLAWSAQLHSSTVGIHPRNRSGLGIRATQVHDLMHDIVSHGFVMAETQKATCIEVDPTTNKEAIYNEQIMLSSEGLLPPLTKPLAALAFCCTHTNQGLRVLDAGLLRGRNKSDILDQDAELRQAVSKGLSWTVVSWKIGRHFPLLIDLFQESGNASGAIARGEGEIQVMLRIHALAAAASEEGQEVNWMQIQATVSRSKPSCLNDIADLISYVRLYAGGHDAKFQNELHTFVRAHAPATRSIKGSFYKRLAAVDLGVEHAVPYVKTACLKAMYAASNKFLNSSGEVVLIKPADLMQMVQDEQVKQRVLEAEAMMKQARQLVQQHAVPPARLISMIGQLDVRLVHHVFKKVDERVGVYEKMCHIGADLVVAMRQMGCDVQSPWESAPAKEATQDPAKPGAEALRSFDSDGNLVSPFAEVAAKGFEIGSAVKQKGESKTAVVSSMHSFRVQVTWDDSHVKEEFDANSFVKMFVLNTAPAVTLIDTWRVNDPMSSDAFDAQIKKGIVMAALRNLYSTNEVYYDKLQLQDKPFRGVFAKEKIAKSQLLLPPASLSVTTGANKMKESTARKVVAFVNGDAVFLSPTFSKEFYSPYWAVRATAAEDTGNINMEVVMKEVEIVVQSETFLVKIPCLQNKKIVQVGDELLTVFKPEASSSAKKEKKVTGKTPAKQPEAEATTPAKKAKKSAK
jgi:hypothetical protein